MATLLLATAPDSANAANYTARFNRAITLGPKSKVYVKSASMTLGQSYAVQTGSNDTVQYATGPTNPLMTATVASGEYTGRDILAAAATTALNNAAEVQNLQDTATGLYVETCSSSSVATNATNILFNILGPQVSTNFPPAGATPDDTFQARNCELSSTGSGVLRKATPAETNWRNFVYVNPAHSRGSGIFQFSIDTKAVKATRILGGLAAQRATDMDPTRATLGILAELGKDPEIYVDGLLVAANGPGGLHVCQQGDYFRIVRSANTVTFMRANGLPAVPAPGAVSPWEVIHEIVGRQTTNLRAFVTLFNPNTRANSLRYTPDISAPFTMQYDSADETEEEAAASAALGAIDPTMLKRTICGNIGILLGFKPGVQYNSTAAATGVITSDQAPSTTGVFPSVQIRCPSLPVETWDSASGQVQPILANIDKQSLIQDLSGLQQLYVEYSPTPIKCYFREPTAISSVQILITDTDGNILEDLTGRTTVMLAFVE
jgi:hypothetical protein